MRETIGYCKFCNNAIFYDDALDRIIYGRCHDGCECELEEETKGKQEVIPNRQKTARQDG